MYKAILFSPDGDKVTDFKRDTKEMVLNELENIGSRWIFYPIHFVATDTTIVDTCEGLEYLKGKRIKTVQRFLKNIFVSDSENILNMFNAGCPANFIYPKEIFTVFNK